MTVDKLSISVDATLGSEVRASASRARQPLSSWVADALAAKLRAEALDAFLAEWEATHGAFTPEEIRRAEEEMGFRPVDPRL